MSEKPEYCDYCLGDFKDDQTPVYVRGDADLAVHRPEDDGGTDCAYWHDWQEFGRWETYRGMQGSRLWPDGSEWEAEPYTEVPNEAL